LKINEKEERAKMVEIEQKTEFLREKYPDATEFIREELVYIASFLQKNYKMKTDKIRRLIREMLTLSI